MNAPVKRRSLPVRQICTNGFLRLALRCARNVFDATDRRMPEARALASWLSQSASAFGLADAAVPDDDALHHARRRGVTAQDWRKIGAALQECGIFLPERQDAPIDRWLGAITKTLALDELEADILALALHYRLDRRVERLFDTLSDSRGDQTQFRRDATLIALLLNAPTAEVASRLTPGARLQASGLLRAQRHGELEVLERLTALMRREISPEADIYSQLLGTTPTEPLPWDAFAHLGREAEVAASVLRAALDGQESGINILLYGPPGTGKTSFAATLAARVGARLRPVAEADDDGGEPCRHERLAGLRLAQRLASSRNSLLLFDEAEDLFVSRGAVFDEPEPNSRVFIHRLLERMSVPVIWTANDIGALGPAVLRRMTMCLELKVPNLLTRTRLWTQMGEEEGVALPEADAARLARLVPTAPAVASTALRAARLAGGGAETARLVVEGLARAVCGGRTPAIEPERDATYDLTLVNADCDLGGLVGRLGRLGTDRAVSFLLSGPPGSGKSA